MVERGLTELTGKPNVADAWLSLVSTQEVVGLKVYTSPGPNSGTRLAVVESVVTGLLSAGFAPTNIVVWDWRVGDLRLAGYFRLQERHGIDIQGAQEAGYDENVYYETALVGTLRYGDHEFGKQGPGVGRRSFVSRLLTERITRIINITPVMHKRSTGVVGHLYSLTMGAVDNTWRFETQPSRFAVAIPEIYALPTLSDRVVLNITDALICQYEGENMSLLHYSVTANEIFFSKDPVVLDVLAMKKLKLHRSTDTPLSDQEEMAIYQNAELLELGRADPDAVEILRIDLNDPADGNQAREGDTSGAFYSRTLTR